MVKTIFFEWYDYEEYIMNKYNIDFGHNVEFYKEKFDINLIQTKHIDCVSIFVDSRLSNNHLDYLKSVGCKKILLRCSGYNMLNVEYAKKIGLTVCRVASYSPESIAEYVFALILNLARRMNRERSKHVNLQNGRDLSSMGFVLRSKVLGLYGYGKIAKEVEKIAKDGFGMKVIFYDPYVSNALENRVESLQDLFSLSDIVSIHVPLNKETYMSVNKNLLLNSKGNIMLINTSRGEIVNSNDVVECIKLGIVKYLGVDVWEDDDKFSSDLIADNIFQSDHIAFLTEEAVLSILQQTKTSMFQPIKENIL